MTKLSHEENKLIDRLDQFLLSRSFPFVQVVVEHIDDDEYWSPHSRNVTGSVLMSDDGQPSKGNFRIVSPSQAIEKIDAGNLRNRDCTERTEKR